jgi:hypothetical protein
MRDCLNIIKIKCKGFIFLYLQVSLNWQPTMINSNYYIREYAKNAKGKIAYDFLKALRSLLILIEQITVFTIKLQISSSSF